MPRHPHGPLTHIDKDVGIKCHHNNKCHQVEHCPEDQVGVAVKWCHVGAMRYATDTVPAHTGDGPHNYGHGPDNDNHHNHTPVAHASVKLHAKHSDMALYGNGQQVGH